MFGNEWASSFVISLTQSGVMVSSQKLWCFAKSPTVFPPGAHVGHAQPQRLSILDLISFLLKEVYDWIYTISIVLTDYSAARDGKHNHWNRSVSTKHIEHVELIITLISIASINHNFHKLVFRRR